LFKVKIPEKKKHNITRELKKLQTLPTQHLTTIISPVIRGMWASSPLIQDRFAVHATVFALRHKAC
jgi:hypothetical protein